VVLVSKPAGRHRRHVQTIPDPPKAIARRLSPKTIDELCQSYLAGAKCSELAGHYGICKTSVQNLLRHEGIQLRRQSLTADQVAEVIVLYELGHSLMTIGTRLELVPSTVYRALKKAGVRLRDPQGRER